MVRLVEIGPAVLEKKSKMCSLQIDTGQQDQKSFWAYRSGELKKYDPVLYWNTFNDNIWIKTIVLK